jgi:hypothetical protein
MKEKMLFIQNDFETFTAQWGAEVSKIPYNDGFICPLGWEEELKNRNIGYEIINYVVENNQEEQ